MSHKTLRKFLCLMLALILALGIAACSSREEDGEESSQESESSANQVSEPEEPSWIPEDFPDFAETIAEWKEVNDETVGYLYIPGTEVDDAVVCRQDFEDYNSHYLRLDIYGNYSMEGVYYADCRNQFDGTAEGLSRNTTIYGHALDMNDDPDEIRFSQLKKYWDEDFAREHPYIYFSLEEEDLVWEIFSVYYTNTSHDYIEPLDNQDEDEIQEWLDSILPRSEYIYDVSVTPDDKFLTLSTCVYKLTPGVYPNKYRFVITAKLVTDGKYHEHAELEVNESPLDPNEVWQAPWNA